MLENELVLRAILDPEKVYSTVGPNITVGRGEGSTVVLAGECTSLAHAEITIAGGNVLLRDLGSEAGTFYGQKDDNGLRRVNENENVQLCEGDTLRFGTHDSELYRIERTSVTNDQALTVAQASLLHPDSTRSAGMDGGGSPPEIFSPHGHLLNGESLDGTQSSNGQGSRDGHQGEELPKSATESSIDNHRNLNVIVTVVRAEGLSATASTSVFRRPKKSQTQNRYVRVRMLDIADGDKELASGVTSSVAGIGPECHWGHAEKDGESIPLLLAGKASNNIGGVGKTSLESAADRDATLEVEAWSDHSASGGGDVLLGRGRTAVLHLGKLEAIHTQPRWVTLSLNGSQKGKIEIVVAIGSNSLPVDDKTRQPDERSREATLKQGGQEMLHSDLDGLDKSLLRNGDEQELVSECSQSERGVEGNVQGEDVAVIEEPKNGLGKKVPTPRSPKWGLPSMPDLKNTLSISLARATTLRESQREKTTKSGLNIKTSSNDAFPVEDSGQGAAGGDMERHSSTEDVSARGTAGEKVSPDKGALQGKKGIASARHGMQSIKESLHATLMGASGKFRPERKGEQSDGVIGEDLQTARDEVSDRPPSSSDSASFSSSGLQSCDEKADAFAALPNRKSLDVAIDRVVDGVDRRIEAGKTNSQGSQSSSTSPQGRRATRNITDSTVSLTENGTGPERRKTEFRVPGPLPLRSLLQEVAGGQVTSNSEGDTLREKDEDGGVNDVPKDTIDVDATSGFERAKETLERTLSSQAVASSLKSAAARVKSKLSSPPFTATLKGFGWHNAKEEGDEDDSSSSALLTDERGEKTADPATPNGALALGILENNHKVAGVHRGTVGSSASLPLAGTTVVVAVFRASSLPEISPKRMFGRSRKDASQNPYVRVRVCGVTAATPAVREEGRECRWGNKKEGEIVELFVAAADLPPTGLPSSSMVVELWNEASEERGEDVLLGSAEILLADWLGKKPAWVDLKVQRNRGGRVKLNVTLNEGQEASTVPHHGLHKVVVDDGDAAGADKEPVSGETLLSGGHSIPTSGTNINVDDASGDAVNNTQQNKDGEHRTLNFTEDNPDGPAVLSRASLGGKGDSEVTTSTDRSEREDERNIPGVPHLDEGSPPTCCPQQTSKGEEIASSSSPMAVEGESEAMNKTVVPEQAEHAAGNEKKSISRGGTRPKGDGEVVAPPMAYEVDVSVEEGGGAAHIKPTEAADQVDIMVLVQEVGALTTSVSKKTLEMHKKSSTQDLYVVLRACGSREETADIVEGSSETQWSGATGKAINLVVPYADLIAAGWGNSEEEGPHLTVEVWDKESQNRQEDAFIGSADVRLKDYLGCGPKEVKVSRRRKIKGQVKMAVESPALQRSETGGDQNIHLATMSARVGNQSTEEIQLAQDPRLNKISSEEEERSEEVRRAQAGETMKNIEGDDPSKFAIGPTSDARIELGGRPARNGSNSDALDNTLRKDENSVSGGSITAGSQATHSEDSRISIGPNGSQSSSTPPLQEGPVSVPLTLNRDSGDHEEGLSEDAVHREDFRVGRGDESAKLSPQVDNNDGSIDTPLCEPPGGKASPLDDPATAATSAHQCTSIITKPSASSDTASTVDLSRQRSMSKIPQQNHQEQRFSPQTSSFCDGEQRECLATITVINRYDRDQRGEMVAANERDQTDGTHPAVQHVALRTNLKEARAAADEVPSDPGQSSDIYMNEGSLLEQKFEQRGKHVNQGRSNELAEIQRANRLGRAREIAKRRREVVSDRRPVGRRRSTHAPHSLQSAQLLAVDTIEQARAASLMQGAFRGRTARRRLRLCRRAAVKIQAAFRGHRERKFLPGLKARTKNAKAEEKRARTRRSRIAWRQQELDLLRRTPAQHLPRIDAIHAEIMASRIQQSWRRYCGGASVRNVPGSAVEEAPRHGGTNARNEGLLIDVDVRGFTAPKIECYKSDRAPASGMTLESLRLRVAARQRAKERSLEEAGLGSLKTQDRQDTFTKTGHGRNANGTVDTTYTLLMERQEKVSCLTSTLRHSEDERLNAAKRRGERLANFRKLQDQLLHPPKLSSSRETGRPAQQYEMSPSDDVQRRRRAVATDDSWRLPDEPAQRDRAQRAHALAVAATNAGGNKKSWATSLPADVGYDKLVDIRRVLPSWPTKTDCRGGRLDYVNGFLRDRTEGAGEGGAGTTSHDFNSDEASLWWYAYASTRNRGLSGPLKKDGVFIELLEKVKTSATQRKEQAEREEHRYRLRVARKTRTILDKAIHKQQAARCPTLSCLRRRTTDAQRSAAIVIQAYARRFIERKRTTVLRAEMRVFEALQVLANELRQPELEDVDTVDPMRNLATFFAEYSGNKKKHT